MSILDYPSLDEIVRALDLAPHPEGGFYRETFRDPLRQDGRAVSTAIYYLLPAGQTSAWHRVDAAEVFAVNCVSVNAEFVPSIIVALVKQFLDLPLNAPGKSLPALSA